MFWNLYEVSRQVVAGDEDRWQEQVAVVRRHQPDILAITEGWDWDKDDHALFKRAKREFGYQHGVLYESKTNCHMATFFNDPISKISEYHQPHIQAWWHGFYRVVLDIPGQSEPFVLLGTHLNPFDPTLRRIEGSWIRQGLPSSKHGMVVMDANAVAPGDPEPVAGLGSHLPGSPTADRVPLETLTAAGMIDVGAAHDDRSPTIGHFGPSAGDLGRQMRIDQAWATPSVRLTGYHVVRDPETDTASDHRPIWVEFGG